MNDSSSSSAASSPASSIGETLRAIVDDAAARMAHVSEEASRARPAPGKWSPREIVGHLVDSASNNHGRFVRGGAGAELVFDGYDADGWVALQRYQDLPWSEIVALWRAFNLHIATVMDAIPEEVRMRKHARHNFDQIGWAEFRTEDEVTLEDLMRDYVGHLEHHLRALPLA